MIAHLSRLGRRGSTAIEFALIVPVMAALVFGIIQAGVLFFANAGLKNGVGEAARLSTLWPPRTDAQITAELRTKAFGIDKAKLPAPVITRGTAQGVPYAEITATYTVPINLYVIALPSVTLRETRRVYIP
jgi:Flp pilus assembly protein TadG